MSKKSVVFAGLLLVVAMSFGGLLIANFGNVKQIIAAGPQVDFKSAPEGQNSNPQLQSLNDAFVEIAKSVTPTVAYIEVTTGSENDEDQNKQFQLPFNLPPEFGNPEGPDGPQGRGSGSGILISNDGYILTNNHVVKNASDNGIKVILTDKREYTAKIGRAHV